MREYVQAAITILSLINPVICASIFVALEGDDLARSGPKEANKTALAILRLPIVCFLLMGRGSRSRKGLAWAICGHLTCIYTSGASLSWPPVLWQPVAKEDNRCLPLS